MESLVWSDRSWLLMTDATDWLRHKMPPWIDSVTQDLRDHVQHRHVDMQRRPHANGPM